MSLLANWTVWTAFALGGEVQVHATRPVVVAIDGAPTGIAGTVVDTRDVAPGRHRIEVRSFMGATLGTVVVHLADHERVELVWDREDRTLLELDRSPLTSPPAESPQPASLLPRARTTAEPVSGSLTVTGLSDLSGAVRVQGQPVTYDSDTQGFLATVLEPPVVELHLRDNGELRYHGAVDVAPGRHRVCQLHYQTTAWRVTCRDGGAERR